MTHQVHSGDPTILATRQDLDMDTCHSVCLTIAQDIASLTSAQLP